MRSRSPFAAVAVAVVAAVAGCGGTGHHGLAVKAKQVCAAGSYRRYGSDRLAYAAVVRSEAAAVRRPGGRVLARFGRINRNGVPMVFGVRGARVDADCAAAWYRVQLPIRPNGITGWVRASEVGLAEVHTRVEVDVSARRLILYRNGRPLIATPVAVGSPQTPTPIGSFYVNQRLIPKDTSGPYGPAAVGVSAFSNVLTGWTQGGPIAIHGTDEPSSIGHAVSNGCVRVPNATLKRIFAATLAGTPVVIHP